MTHTSSTPRWLVDRGLQTIRELNGWLLTVDDHRGLDHQLAASVLRDNLYLVRNSNRRLLVAAAPAGVPGFPLHVTSQTAHDMVIRFCRILRIFPRRDLCAICGS